MEIKFFFQFRPMLGWWAPPMGQIESNDGDDQDSGQSDPLEIEDDPFFTQRI
jgi:hypothetical protein